MIAEARLRLGRFDVRLERKCQDVWIGAFWKSSWFIDGREAARLIDVWVCVVPCFPLHIKWAGPWQDNPMLRRYQESTLDKQGEKA